MASHPGPKCGRPKRQGGDACGQAAGWGTDHPGIGACKLHGGNTPGARNRARRELEHRAAEQAVQTYGLPVEIDPSTALLQEVQRTAGHVAWLGQRVAQLEADDLVWGVVLERESTGGEHGDGSVLERRAALNVWVQLYQEERRHLARVSSAAVAAGVAERQVRLAEQTGAQITEGLRWLAAALTARWQLDARQAEDFHALVGTMLSALADGVQLPAVTAST